jgi:SAM-dependent MidA family methyltransferase
LKEPARKIASEIESRGIITFSRFMELALYCPEYGYYEKDLYNLGKAGDFYTSVNVGSLFGQLLAFQFTDWQREFSPGGTLELVEAGAHDGALAFDILNWIQQHRPDILERTGYVILESSAHRKETQAVGLQKFNNHTSWLPGIHALPRSGDDSFRIIFANEFLDALPVHRLGWNAHRKEWFEWGVRLVEGGFVWGQMTPGDIAAEAAARLIPREQDLLDALPDGFTLELCPQALDWWQRAALSLANGKLLTFDYGQDTEEWLSPGRTDGTLRAYRKHRLSSDVLASPGDQDLTAHVNFSALQKVGEEAGLRIDFLMSQERFLGGVAARAIQDGAGFCDWTSQQARQLQTLTHPEFFGNRFRVLMQSKAK